MATACTRSATSLGDAGRRVAARALANSLALPKRRSGEGSSARAITRSSSGVTSALKRDGEIATEGHELEEALDGVVAGEECVSGETLPKHGGGAEDVGSRVDLALEHLLGSDVSSIAIHALDERSTHVLRERKIHDVRVTVGRDDDFTRAEAAVDEPERFAPLGRRAMARMKRSEHIAGKGDRDRRRQGTPLPEQTRERDAGRVVHHEQRLAVEVDQIANLDHERVPQRPPEQDAPRVAAALRLAELSLRRMKENGARRFLAALVVREPELGKVAVRRSFGVPVAIEVRRRPARLVGEAQRRGHDVGACRIVCADVVRESVVSAAEAFLSLIFRGFEVRAAHPKERRPRTSAIALEGRALRRPGGSPARNS